MASDYDKIQGAMENTTTVRAIAAYYTGDVSTGPTPDPKRKFLAYVLSKEAPVLAATVLVYQYEGIGITDPPGSLENWRCFKVSGLTYVNVFDYAPTFTPPDPLTFKQLKKQSCVDDVEVWRKKKYS